MRFFLLDAHGRRIGPYDHEELALLRSRSLIGDDTLVIPEFGQNVQTLSRILADPRADGGMPSPRSAAAGTGGDDARVGGSRNPEGSVAGDFLRLAPHLMMPLEDIRGLRWRDNRRILALAFVGLMPLVLLMYLQTARDVGAVYWGFALYTSLLWGLFFYVTFSQPEVTIGRCFLTFAGTAIFSIGLVALARYVVPFEWVRTMTGANSLAPRWIGHFFGVALIEELAKLFTLYFLWPSRPRPQVMMFYGLMAGLGFGIYEGVAYQTSQNLRFAFPGGVPTWEGAGVYYILNLLRLTSLPFLHAMWTGIAGYFVGLAGRFPQRPGGLLLAALVVPSLLHASYNTFSTSLVGLTVALVTVLALNLYLAKGRDFERALNGDAPH